MCREREKAWAPFDCMTACIVPRQISPNTRVKSSCYSYMKSHDRYELCSGI